MDNKNIRLYPYSLILVAVGAALYLPFATMEYASARIFIPLIYGVSYHILAIGAGTALLSFITPQIFKTQKDVWVLGWVAGLGAFGLYQFLTAQLGIFNSLSATATIFFGLIGIFILLKKEYKLGEEIASTFKSPNIFSMLAFAVCLLAIWFSSAPPSYYDTLTYHLGLPMQYLAWGKSVYSMHYSHTASPILGEMILSPVLALFGNDPIYMNVAHGLTFCLLVLLVNRLTAHFISEKASGAAAFAFAVMPVAFFCGISMKPDVFTALFELAAFYIFLWIIEKDSPEKDRTRDGFILLGLFIGFGLGTKFFVLIFGFILYMMLIIWPKWRKSISIKYWFFSGILAGLVGCGWYVANWIHLGNPVYPFAPGVFGEPEWGEHTRQLINNVNPHLSSLSDWLGIWKLPFTMTFEIIDGTMNNSPGILLFFVFPTLIFFKNLPKSLKSLLIVLAVMTPVWLVTHMALRYFPALWIIGSIASGYAIYRWQELGKHLSIPVFIVVLVLGCTNLAYSFQFNEILLRESSDYLFGNKNKDEFLSEVLEPYQGYKFANENLPQDAVVFLVNDSRFAYLEKRAVLSGVWVMPTLDYIVRHSQTSDEILNKIKETGATHYFIHIGGFNRLSKHFKWIKWNREQFINYQAFTKGLGKSLYQDKHVKLFKLPDKLATMPTEKKLTPGSTVEDENKK